MRNRDRLVELGLEPPATRAHRPILPQKRAQGSAAARTATPHLSSLLPQRRSGRSRCDVNYAEPSLALRGRPNEAALSDGEGARTTDGDFVISDFVVSSPKRLAARSQPPRERPPPGAKSARAFRIDVHTFIASYLGEHVPGPPTKVSLSFVNPSLSPFLPLSTLPLYPLLPLPISPCPLTISPLISPPPPPLSPPPLPIKASVVDELTSGSRGVKWSKYPGCLEWQNALVRERVFFTDLFRN